MSIPAIEPASTRIRLVPLIGGLGLGAFGLLAAYMLGAAIWSWWIAFDYIPVQAQVRHVQHYSVPSKHGRMERSAFTYLYQVSGDQIEGTADIPGAAIDAGQVIPVWFDPEQPQKAVLTRQFEWLSLYLLPFATVFTTIGMAALFARDDFFTVPARGRLVRADPDAYRVLSIFAVMVNLAAWPLAAIAAVPFARGDGACWMFALFALPLAALLLARGARRRHVIRRGLGTPLLEIFPSPAGQFKARLHFQPALATRSDARVERVLVQVQVAQAQRVSRGKRNEVIFPWAHRIEATLARGSDHADFSVAVPDWPVPYAGVEPACWKISVMALEASAHFRLAPDFIRGGPASTP